MKNRTKTLALAAVAAAVLLSSGFKASAAGIERIYGENPMSPIAAVVTRATPRARNMRVAAGPGVHRSNACSKARVVTSSRSARSSTARSRRNVTGPARPARSRRVRSSARSKMSGGAAAVVSAMRRYAPAREGGQSLLAGAEKRCQYGRFRDGEAF